MATITTEQRIAELESQVAQLLALLAPQATGDQQIEELPNLPFGEVADDDLLVIADVSDTTDDPGGTTKNVKMDVIADYMPTLTIPGNNNEVLTSDGAGGLVAESGFTFNGNRLTITPSSNDVNISSNNAAGVNCFDVYSTGNLYTRGASITMANGRNWLLINTASHFEVYDGSASASRGSCDRSAAAVASPGSGSAAPGLRRVGRRSVPCSRA